MKLRIYIPTLNRVDKQIALSEMPDTAWKLTTLVCHPTEVAVLKKRWPECKVVACPVQGKGSIAAVRQWINDYAWKQGHRYIIQLDDDTTVQVAKRQSGKVRMVPATSGEYMDALAWCEDRLKQYAHVALVARYLDWDQCSGEKYGKSAINFVGFDLKKVREAGAKYGKNIPKKHGIMEDLDITLQLLVAGYPNAVSLKYRANQHVRGAPGGCAEWRLDKHSDPSATALAKAFPGLVVWERGGKLKRENFKVYWQKAMNQGLEKNREA